MPTNHIQVATESAKSLTISFNDKLIALVPSLIASVAIFVSFYIVACVARFLVRRVFSRLTDYKPLVDLAAKIAFLTIVIIGLITALGTAGINISAMVASLGLFGFTLGFAFKDMLTNTLAGVMILFYRPFCVGDVISGKDFTGKVTEVNLRYIILSDKDKTVLVPNSTMLSTIVHVNNAV